MAALLNANSPMIIILLYYIFEYIEETKLKFRSFNFINNNIDSIDSYAFSNLLKFEAFNDNYPFISITNDVITTLRSFAFNNINEFNRIDLSNNRIESLENYSFNNRMKIYSIKYRTIQ